MRASMQSAGTAAHAAAGARRWLVALVAGLATVPAGAAGPVAPGGAAADDTQEVRRQPSWPAATRQRADELVAAWLGSIADPAARARGAEAWTASSPATDLLDAAMAATGAVDPRAAAAAASVDDRRGLADLAWLGESSVAPFERDTLRAWIGRELVRRDRFDEALPVLASVDPVAAVDPAAVLFHSAACQHWLLDSQVAITTLDRLLERAGEIPLRYERVARLLRADMAGLEDESLDHIARRMRDVTRRLGLGRAGARTRAVQDGVIESLDKLIARLEQEQQSQSGGGGGAGSGSGSGQGGQPMDDSRPAGGKGPGEVTRKDLEAGEGWGQLPPHKREEALQQIGREYPAHYREAIEQYFKRLAAGEEQPPSR